MKREDFGYDPETGKHSRAFTEAEASMMEVLTDHVGKDLAISANDLTIQFHITQDQSDISGYSKRDFENAKREIREIINHLIIDHGQEILTKAGIKGGYWIAGSKAEADQFYESFRKRFMTGITKACRGKRNVVVKTVKQLVFEFDELRGAMIPGIVKPYDRGSTPLAVMTAFLDKMTREPEKFEREIRLLRDKFGKVLLPKEEFARIQDLSRELQVVLAKVA